MFDLVEHMRRQMAFSRATFGTGERTKGILDHLQKEIKEIKEVPEDKLRSQEWIDIVLLGLDGLWRSMEAEGVNWNKIPGCLCDDLRAKQDENEQRRWPDWRTAPTDKAIEHVREVEA